MTPALGLGPLTVRGGPRPGPWVALSPCTASCLCPLQNSELVLHEGAYKVLQRGPGRDPPYKVRYTGTYLTVETPGGLVLSWDRKTSVFIQLRQDYKVRAGRGPLWAGQSPSSESWP